jgi:hypothetical protein
MNLDTNLINLAYRLIITYEYKFFCNFTVQFLLEFVLFHKNVDTKYI